MEARQAVLCAPPHVGILLDQENATRLIRTVVDDLKAASSTANAMDICQVSLGALVQCFSHLGMLLVEAIFLALVVCLSSLLPLFSLSLSPSISYSLSFPLSFLCLSDGAFFLLHLP